MENCTQMMIRQLTYMEKKRVNKGYEVSFVGVNSHGED